MFVGFGSGAAETSGGSPKTAAFHSSGVPRYLFRTTSRSGAIRQKPHFSRKQASV